MQKNHFNLSLVFIVLLVSIPAFGQTNLSVQELKEQYSLFYEIANDSDVLWLYSNDDEVRDNDRRYIRELNLDKDLDSGRFVSRALFDKLLVDKIMREENRTIEERIKSISGHIRMSQIIKANIRDELLPKLAELIKKRENSPNPNTNLNNNTYHQPNNTSVDDILERITSDEHLNTLSFDNILASLNEGGTTIQATQVDSFDGDWNDAINSHYSSCPKTKPDDRSSFKAYPNGQTSGNTYRYCVYFGNGYLQREEPYINGKLDGLKITYSWSKKYNFSYASYRENYSNGQRNGLYEYYRLTKTGAVYRSSLVTYSNGLKHGDAANWHENGQTKTNSNFFKGKIILQYNYREDGTFTYCTKWDSKGYPHDCKTGNRR